MLSAGISRASAARACACCSHVSALHIEHWQPSLTVGWHPGSFHLLAPWHLPYSAEDALFKFEGTPRLSQPRYRHDQVDDARVRFPPVPWVLGASSSRHGVVARSSSSASMSTPLAVRSQAAEP